MRGARVLLVDDEEEFTSLLSERMQARGLQVDVASNGLTALAKVKDAGYDAIILDMSMPGMDGIETLRRLLEENPGLQVIMLTGRATVQKGVEAAKLGAREVLEKPTDLDALLEKISAAKMDRVMLLERRMASEIADILKTKGW